MTTFATVVPLHTMIRDALTQLRASRADSAPDHDSVRCSGVCRVCANEANLNRLLDRLPRVSKILWPPKDTLGL